MTAGSRRGTFCGNSRVFVFGERAVLVNFQVLQVLPSALFSFCTNCLMLVPTAAHPLHVEGQFWAGGPDLVCPSSSPPLLFPTASPPCSPAEGWEGTPLGSSTGHRRCFGLQFRGLIPFSVSWTLQPVGLVFIFSLPTS